MTLPNFILGGAKKAGTTSLYEYLKQHPQVYMTALKEPRFFAYNPADPQHVKMDRQSFPIRTLDDYTRLFADVRGEQAIGEGSPMYLTSEFARHQIHDLIPDVKLIFSLRHPVERAYSLYTMRLRDGMENRPPMQAFTEDPERWQRFKYYEQLQQWFALFPTDQIKVILFDELKARPVAIVQELFGFLEVVPDFVPDMSRQHNVGGVPKSKVLHSVFRTLRRSRFKEMLVNRTPNRLRSSFTQLRDANLQKSPPMSPDVAAYLTELYRDDVVKLADLLQRDLSVWQWQSAEDSAVSATEASPQ